MVAVLCWRLAEPMALLQGSQKHALERCCFPVTEAERVKLKLQRQRTGMDMQTAKSNHEPEHAHVLHGSPKSICKWSCSHSPKKEHVPVGFVWHHPLQLSKSTKQSHGAEGCTPGNLEHLLDLQGHQPWVCIWPHSYLFPLLTPCTERPGTFQPPSSGSREEHCTCSLLLYCTPDLWSWRLLPWRSLLPIERAYSINFPNDFHESIINRHSGIAIYTASAALEQLNYVEELPSFPIL